MKNIMERLTKLEAVAGIMPRGNPFVAHKSFPFTNRDWTTDELFKLFMGDESLMWKM